MQHRGSFPLWATWLCWIGVSVVAWVAAAFVQKFIAASIESFGVVSFVFGAVAGTLILACVQSVVLAPYLASRRRWIGYSVLAAGWGGFSALAIGIPVLFTMLSFISYSPSPLFASLNAFSIIFLSAGAMGGACIGHIQREYFQSSVAGRTHWVLSWALGVDLAMFLFMPWALNIFLNAVLCGVIYGIVTGFALLSVLKTPPAPHVDQPPYADEAPVTA